MGELPDPLVPPKVDLRDFAFMPLDVVRLRDSELAAVEDGEIFRAAVLSWCAAWHQIPAASLPNDDHVLARLLGYGRDVKGWQKLRTKGALRGWIQCSDGRLYHPVVAEKARDAWIGKLRQRWQTECARIKKHNQRHKTAVECPDFEEWMSQGCPQGQPLPVPGKDGPMSQGRPPDVSREMGSKGQGEGQGEGQIERQERSTEFSPTAPASSSRGTVAATLRAAGVQVTAMHPLLVTWVDELKASDEQLREAIDRARQHKPAPEPIPAKYLDPIVRDVMQPKTNGARRAHAAVPETDFSKLDYSKGF